MARRNASQFAYHTLRIEGGLIPADELARLTSLADPEQTGQTEVHYRVPKGLKLRDEIARYWKIARNLWVEFDALRARQDGDAHAATVRGFLVPLLRDVLGFVDLADGAEVVADEHRYPVGHAAREGRLPVVLAGHDQPLDSAVERFGETNPDTGRTRRRSPFMLAQEALNASGHSLWAIVTNGLRYRILRDNPSLTRPAYVEADLETMFSEERYADFTAFWLLAHASRFGEPGTEAADCAWERWRNAGQQAGIRARDRLRDGVAEALRALGTGFVSHPANGALREALQREPGPGAMDRQGFFEELLALVYRLIFLATVEDRVEPATGLPLVFAPGSGEVERERYLAGYSMTMLRERAARRGAHDRHGDLWQALSITFEGLAQGQPELGLPALGGLFASDQCPHLDGAAIENRWLLAAIYQLGWFREPGGLSRVNYRDMGPEELGSVYESLLELVPELRNLNQSHAARFGFVGDEGADPAGASSRGSARKLTGSYYTPDSLVQELIKSALEPVIGDTLKAHPERPIEALLALTVCDPACGSGHFLLAAARRLADEVARLRAVADGSGTPTPADYRLALRDVVGRCLFGVDRNPMAIALARTALWLEAYTPERPLSFLDHHLRCGDALLGVLDPQVLENGIPDAAYAQLSGDDKAVAAELRKRNRAELKSWRKIAAGDLLHTADLAARASEIDGIADDSLAGIHDKRRAWADTEEQARAGAAVRAADAFVAAFLIPKRPEEANCVPSSGYLWALLNDGAAHVEGDEKVRQICDAHGVFHWWLAFPQVAARGGFDVMLGNPPWERIKLQEEEFFASRSPLVATARNKAERASRIELLAQGMLLHTLHPDVEAAEGLSPPNRAEIALHGEFTRARRGAEAASLFAHDSERYPLTGVGDVNTYALFAETFSQLMAGSGRAGFIVPTGIATDDSTKAFFADISQRGRLASLYDFENSQGIFPAVHRSYKFSLMTLGAAPAAHFICFATRIEQLADAERRFTLTPDEFRLINPNTRTCPVFRSRRDAELTKKLYRAAPVLIAEAQPNASGGMVNEVNPWGISFQRMLDMSNDSSLFHDAPESPGEPRRLPLYEAKMIHQFDHRWATYVPSADGLATEDCTDAQKSDPGFAVRPRYWVDEREVLARIARVPARVSKAWLAAHGAQPAERRDAEDRLRFTIASWIAGELFRRAAGAPGIDDSGKPAWADRQRMAGLKSAESALSSRFRCFHEALEAAGVSGRKALAEFGSWALQDAESGLDGDELAALQRWQAGRDEPQAVAALMELLDAWMDSRSPRWLMGWRDITNATNERTVIASVIPRAGVGNNLPLMLFRQDLIPTQAAALLGNLNSLVLDFVARHKVGGTHLNYFIYKQLPVLPPERYTERELDFVVPRLRDLTYTALDLAHWGGELGCGGSPSSWDDIRRARLRAELDACFARLYGLDRNELRYILDPADVMGSDYPSETFRVLKNNEERLFGEYRTRRLVLQAWDSLESGLLA
ncbi:MAG: N-6 DNA methylase [Anaerolineae bacterium]|nr:N-6 DNA methylase [Anaerolineae bacterium]